MAGRVFVTAGLGGMSGAPAKAAVVAGCIGVVAEVEEAALGAPGEIAPFGARGAGSQVERIPRHALLIDAAALNRQATLRFSGWRATPFE